MYPMDIPGITGKSIGKFVFNENINEQTIRQLINEIPPQTVVVFYDRDYPSLSDPGAFVSFKRDGNKYKIQHTNYGWHTRWKTITVESLIDYFFKCSKYNIGLNDYSGEMMYFQSPSKKWWEFWK